MVCVSYAGGLGENLFQYVFARVVAERKNYFLDAAPIFGFPETFKSFRGKRVVVPEVRWTGAYVTDWQTGEVVSEVELFSGSYAKIRLDGWFQRLQYFEEHLKEIKETWLAMDRLPEKQAEDEIAICIRFGQGTHWQVQDCHHLVSYPPPIYSRPTAAVVREFLEKRDFKKIWFVTDFPGCDFFKYLGDIKFEIYSEGEEQDLRFASLFSNIAFAWTPLDWWAAFLSSAENCWSLCTPPSSAFVRSAAALTKVPTVPDYRVDLPNFIYEWRNDMQRVSRRKGGGSGKGVGKRKAKK